MFYVYIIQSESSKKLYVGFSENLKLPELTLGGLCARLKSSFDAHGCIDSAFLTHCRDCSNCFGCTGLRSKSYHIFNQPYSKEEYAKKIQPLNLGSHKNYQEVHSQFKDLEGKLIKPAYTWRNTTNSSGDLLKNCRNCKNCFLSSEGEDNAHCMLMEKNFKDCYDVWLSMENLELCYEVAAGGRDNRGSRFGVTLYGGASDLQYCYTCIGSRNSFGCTGLKENEYCILDKQYSKEEYEELVPKIIKQMDDMPYVDKNGRVYKYGEFFPAEISPFAYNETMAQEYFPLTKEEVNKQGYGWKEPDDRDYKITKISGSLPDDISDADDSLSNETIGCEHEGKCSERCTKAFRIIREELDLYKRRMYLSPGYAPIAVTTDACKGIPSNCGIGNACAMGSNRKTTFTTTPWRTSMARIIAPMNLKQAICPKAKKPSIASSVIKQK